MGVTHTFVSAIADDPTAAAAGQVLPSHWNASHTVNVNLASEVTGTLPIANGGTGTTTPALVAGTNITISGTWPNQTINSTGGAPGGSTTQLQYNNAGAFGGTSGITTTGTELTIASGTKTASAPVLDITQTWNNAAVTFTGLKANVTDTASNSASLLMDLQVGGSSKFKIRKNGQVDFVYGLYSPPVSLWESYTAAINLNGVSQLTWASGIPTIGSYDLALARDAANTLAQRNGTNAQTLRVYNTYTDASNYERAKIAWDTNVLKIGTEKAGTGTARALELQTDGTTRVTVATSGQVTFSSSTVASHYISTTAGYYFSTGGAWGKINANNNGVFALYNGAETDFSRLQFGGTTSSFPAIKRSSATLQARLADDSAYAVVDCAQIGTRTAYTVATLPAAGTAGRRAYVTDATTPTWLGTLTGGGAVVCPVFDNGTAWVAG